MGLLTVPMPAALAAEFTRSDAAPAFPVKVSANQRYLTDQKSRPFLHHADTPRLLFYRPRSRM